MRQVNKSIGSYNKLTKNYYKTYVKNSQGFEKAIATISKTGHIVKLSESYQAIYELNTVMVMIDKGLHDIKIKELCRTDLERLEVLNTLRESADLQLGASDSGPDLVAQAIQSLDAIEVMCIVHDVDPEPYKELRRQVETLTGTKLFEPVDTLIDYYSKKVETV